MRALILIPCLCLTAAAQAPAGFAARLQALEATVARHYRGQPIAEAKAEVEAASSALTARIQAFNARIEAGRAGRIQADAALQAARAAIEVLDKRLKDLPMGNDAAAEARYNALLADRNGKVHAYNALIDQGKAEASAAEAQNAPERKAIEAQRLDLDRRQSALNARIEAFNAFQRERKDMALFQAINRLLADLRASERSRAPAPPELAAVRRLRRELAAWAIAQERADPYGLIIAEVRVGDEPCWFIVDTGAQWLTLPLELAAALGLEDKLGGSTPLVLAGGHRIQGRDLVVPQVAVGGRAVTQVTASVIPATSIGVDGLLGQSFLRRVSWSLDPAQAEPLQVR